jgi:hypothetical protein
MAKDSEHACRDDKCCIEVLHIRNPFSRLIDTCCDGLIHQQFRLSVRAEASDQPTVVYTAPQFDTSAANAAGTVGEGALASTAIQQAGPIFPFGTVVATNLSAASFTFIVEGDAEEDTQIVVPPGSQAAITAPRISVVLVVHPTDPIRGVFDFDIFYPTDPIHPGDPV